MFLVSTLVDGKGAAMGTKDFEEFLRSGRDRLLYPLVSLSSEAEARYSGREYDLTRGGSLHWKKSLKRLQKRVPAALLEVRSWTFYL